MSNRRNEMLFSPYILGKVELPNRVVMASLGRSRSGEGGVPTPLMAEYYAQRASVGLIVTEATTISAKGPAYDGMPGISTVAQMAGWELLSHAVHTCGGRIFLQLCHVGRISHTSLEPDDRSPVAPSALRADATTLANGHRVDVSEPRALETVEIKDIVQCYVLATRNALWAGFDGVEIQAGDGFLIDQFLCDGSNRRTDDYGGAIENRVRLLSEVVTAVIEEAGEDCVGVRLSPASGLNGSHDSDPVSLFLHVFETLDSLRPLYLHVEDKRVDDFPFFDHGFDFQELRKCFHRTYIASGAYTRVAAEDAVAGGYADLVSFGVDFVANPDLVERMRVDGPLALPDPLTVLGGGAEGYTDY
jgi:N-ethylmaleimide reductase